MNLPWSPFTFTQFFSFNLLIFPLFLILSMATKAFQQQNGEPDRSSCGDQFDVGLRRQCMRGEWEEKYYFEHGSQTCRLFWYDGCPSSSGTRNFFDSLLECQWLCEPGLKASNCLEPFDEHLRDECKQGAEWQRRFYFDRNKLRCVSFWFDGCESGSQNQFDEEQECLQQCEMPATQATKKLLSRPDTQSTISIHPTSSQFVPAWRMIGQTTTNSPLNKVRAMDQRITMANDLRESTQRSTFLTHPSTRPNNNKWNSQNSRNEPITLTTRPSPQLPPFTPIQSSNHRPHSSMTMTSNSPKMAQQTNKWQQQNIRKEEANICERVNPCKNNGTCVWDAILKQHICRCAPGFTNDNCTERIDFDPCSPDPCQNGATCAAKVGPDEQTQYDCYCTRGFAGKHCELKPCEENPCKNGGTCRTTRSTTLFFCACPPGWGGKTCMIAIPPSAEVNDELAQPDANFTQQLSSGKIEWIEHLRKITPKMPTTTIKNESVDSFEREYSTSEEEDGLVSRRSKDAPSTASEFVVGEENPTRTLKGSNSQEQFYDKKNSAAKWWRKTNWTTQILTIFILFLFIHEYI